MLLTEFEQIIRKTKKISENTNLSVQINLLYKYSKHKYIFFKYLVSYLFKYDILQNRTEIRKIYSIRTCIRTSGSTHILHSPIFRKSCSWSDSVNTFLTFPCSFNLCCSTEKKNICCKFVTRRNI